MRDMVVSDLMPPRLHGIYFSILGAYWHLALCLAEEPWHNLENIYSKFPPLNHEGLC